MSAADDSTTDKGIAVVTGASRGIGSACARSLAEAGFRVCVHYNSSKAGAEKLAAEIPGDAFVLGADISTIEGADSIYEALRKQYGGNVAVLVNNAGVARDNPIFNATLEEYDETLNTNLRSTWYLTKRLSRLMIRKKAGRVINLSSVVASVANPTQAIYAMTKAAVESFTRTAAVELADYNILVNAVAPGFIETDMTRELPEEIKAELMKKIPLGRIGAAEEVADVVRFLATGGSYITGSVVHVNGGMYGG